MDYLAEVERRSKTVARAADSVIRSHKEAMAVWDIELLATETLNVGLELEAISRALLHKSLADPSLNRSPVDDAINRVASMLSKVMSELASDLQKFGDLGYDIAKTVARLHEQADFWGRCEDSADSSIEATLPRLGRVTEDHGRGLTRHGGW